MSSTDDIGQKKRFQVRGSNPRPGINSRCLDAFIVALSQPRAGGNKQWYASTLQLQLASFDYCRACRRVPTLLVRATRDSPYSLWGPLTTVKQR
ncbi:unnamed protein product, partial [Ectocarpus sp. 8 AP-2014]